LRHPALRAAHLRGDHEDVANLVARLDRINDEIGDNDPETVELLALVVAPIRRPPVMNSWRRRLDRTVTHVILDRCRVVPGE
jgi:hypothetical protein